MTTPELAAAKAAEALDQAAEPTSEPAEIADLPAEVRQLIHAVDHMRDHWAEADDARRRELWQAVHTASDAVWARERV